MTPEGKHDSREDIRCLYPQYCGREWCDCAPVNRSAVETCPLCGGDCGAALPPPILCPMRPAQT